MNKEDILRQLDTFPFDRTEYWLVTGAAMVLCGIKKETGDIDLGCSEKLADRLEEEGFLFRYTEDKKRCFRYGENIEIFENWMKGALVWCEGFQTVDADGLIEMKKELGREKDRKDIALIEEYVRNRKTGILFVCHGNICRSPMAEFVMKELIRREGLENRFDIASAATSREEIGNPVYPPAKRKLKEHGIDCTGKTARQMTKADLENFDMIICMDSWNVKNALRITGPDHEQRITKLLDYTDRKGEDISDPWYTGDFEEAWNDISVGCEGLLAFLKEHMGYGGKRS